MQRLSQISQQLSQMGAQITRKFVTIEPQWQKPFGPFTDINVYNSAMKEKIPLIFPNKNLVTWYTCGPTVYDSPHLGHASCYVKLDIIQRILRDHFRFNLVTAMNITDIDDKIITKSEQSGTVWHEVARHYECEFWEDLKKLNVKPPDIVLRVTDYIPNIIKFIEILIEKDSAYEASDGSVYFDVQKYPHYGKLQKIRDDQLSEQSEISSNKRHSSDFALWKAQKSENEPSWQSPWGPGRPGWHIECSTLASVMFGRKIDVHAGGIDLKFPHHENEEAQSCAYHGRNQWVNYWLHAGHLSIKGQAQKMSKSLKNTIMVDEMLKKYNANEFRMACMLSNYKNSMEYGNDLMQKSRRLIDTFLEFHNDCDAYLTGKKQTGYLDSTNIMQNLAYAYDEVEESLKDDFDTARTISVLHDLISGISRGINTNVNSNVVSGSCLDSVAAVKNFVQRCFRTFGFTTAEHQSTLAQPGYSDKDINLNELLEDILQSRTLIRKRAVASKSQDLFQICDELRNCLKQHGILVKDHSQGSSWIFKSNQKEI